MDMETMTFGKYKGTKVFEVVLFHIGYIHWCLSNVKGFELDEKQQRLYDMLATAYHLLDAKLPVDLRDFVKNKAAYDAGITPLRIVDGRVFTCDPKAQELLWDYLHVFDGTVVRIHKITL